MNETINQQEFSGAEILVESLCRAGIERVFAYPGGPITNLHQAFIREPRIELILPRHEQGGGFMAAGCARATGQTAVCVATSGPGATNLVTAIADAYADSIPVVFITGQVSTTLIGRNAFQECDFMGITRSIVKHSYMVMSAQDLPRIMAEAFLLANTGRPGPIVIDVPKDIQLQKCIPNFADNVQIRAYKRELPLDQIDIDYMRNAIEQAERPCLYVGGGVISAGATDALRQFAESYNIPVTTTLMAIGALPNEHPLCLQWLGMHGTFSANYAVNSADLVIVLGARFDDRVTGDVNKFAKHARIIHVDIDFSEINKNKKVERGVLCNVKKVLDALNLEPLYKPYTAWHEKLNSLKKQYPFKYKKEPTGIKPQEVIEALSLATKGEAIIVPGVGQHQMWSAQFFNYKYPRQLITSAGLGTMGFGLPTAIGVKLVCPEKTVINIDGDGSFQMNIQELGTVFAEKVNVKIVIINNQHLGMVAQWEDRFFQSRRAQTVLSVAHSPRPYPDFVTIAKGYGIMGLEVTQKEDLMPAIEKMLAHDGPFILDVHTPYGEHVLPMIPGGGSFEDVILE